MVPEEQQAILPDTAEITRDLEYMTARWDQLEQPAMFELRAFKEGVAPKTAKFSPDWIEDAADWAESMNNLGYNLYAVRNPIRADLTGSATDADIIGAFFLWADCDDPAAVDNVRRFDGPQCSASVVTGDQPSTRVHLYWQLSEPVTDMSAWRDMQTRIAAHFGSDRTVVNPSRIMRLGGTVAYPAKHKVERGYQKFLTTFRNSYSTPRDPVSFDQMGRVFKDAPQSATQPAHSGFHVDTGPQPLDRERMAIQALSGQEWHGAVIRLVASYVSRGLSDAEIHALTDPLTLSGYTIEQTRAEVQTAINGARAKGWTPQEHTPNFDHAPAPTSSDPSPKREGWKVQSAMDFTADFVAPEYLVDGIVQRGRLYTLTAPTGSGKTAVMLYASTAIATGGQFCGLDVDAGDVLFLAGENPDDVRARVIATLDFYGVDPRSCRLHFVAGTFSIRQDMQRLKEVAASLPNLVLIVVDTFAAYFDGEDENSNAQALDFARVVRGLTQIESKPAVIMPAHPVKNASRQNLAPKGGSSLVNEVDGNLTLWNDDGLITMHWQVKHRGPDFEPLKLELERRECSKLADKHGRIIPTILAKPVLSMRATQIAREVISLEDQLLLNIGDAPELSARQRADVLGISTGRYSRIMDTLRSQKLVRMFRRKPELTKDGERAVEEITSGLKQPEDM